MSDELLEINLGSLRVREIETIEEITGEPIDVTFDPKNPKPRGKALRAIGFVIKRRTDPEFTLEQAGDLMISLADPEPDPT